MSGSTVYAGGLFNTVGDGIINPSATRNFLAAFDAAGTGTGTGTGAVVSSWDPSPNSTVYALAVAGNTVYAGGSFSSVNDSTSPVGRNALAAFDATGTVTAWNPNADNYVLALAVSGSTVYAGGAFTTIGAQSVSHLAAIGTDGTVAAWNPSPNNYVLALAVSGSTVYAGGRFGTLGTNPLTAANRGYLAAIDTTTGTPTAWNPDLDGFVNALAVSGSTVYAGGSFTTLGVGTVPATRNYLAAIGPDGTADAWSPNADSDVQALAVSGTTVYAGGNFTALTAPAGIAQTGSPTAYLARLNPLPCSSGIGLTTGAGAKWQQLALPCAPSATTASVANVLGSGQTANLSAAVYNRDWILYGRNAINTGNVALNTSSLLSPGAGYWTKSFADPRNGLLTVAGVPTDVQTGITGCQSTTGCVVVSVNATTAGSRMIGNPFAYNVDWSRVRVRINGATPVTPSAAFAAGILDKQIWIWNGNDYATWDDAGTPGNLQYFKSFFVKVMASGVGKTIELLIPAEVSTLAAAPAARSWATALLDWLIPSAAAADGDWQVRLQVDNPKTQATTRALLGQRAAAADGYDSADLSAMAPFASPYLTLVFPQPAWGARKGDYATDFRPAGGWPGTWTLELRTDAVGAPVVLRWEGSAAVLARSRLTDGLTGKVIDPSDPAYAQGYPLTLTTKVRRLTWEYLGQ